MSLLRPSTDAGMYISSPTERMSTNPNYSLKEDIRQYWSDRSKTFDLAFGHKIAPGPELEAWRAVIRQQLGERPLQVLELACGTGEVTNVLLSLGHRVTAIDFSEAMLEVARRKHADKLSHVRFALADAEHLLEPDDSYDAIVCRHLVWTLTTPETALRGWHRLLRPGGMLLVFDGDWSKPSGLGHTAAWAVALLDRIMGADANYDGAMSGRHADIMRRLPFGSGLAADQLTGLLRDAGFADIYTSAWSAIPRAQRRNADLRNRLRTFVYKRFMMRARKPDVPG